MDGGATVRQEVDANTRIRGVDYNVPGDVDGPRWHVEGGDLDAIAGGVVYRAVAERGVPTQNLHSCEPLDDGPVEGATRYQPHPSLLALGLHGAPVDEEMPACGVNIPNSLPKHPFM